MRFKMQANKESRGTTRGLIMQVITTLALAMPHFNMASSIAFSGVFTEQLSAGAADISLSASQISWVASVFSVGTMAGFLVSSYLNPSLGAICLVRICAPAIATGWTLMALGGSFGVILAGRLLTGLAVGSCLAPTVTHVGEISSVHVRGFLTTSLVMFGCFGIMCTYLAGWLLGWRHACLAVGIGPMVLMFAISLALPRSAKWLVSKGHPLEEAERSLRFYLGDGCDVSGHIAEIRESLGEQHDHDAGVLQVLHLLRHRHCYIPCLLILGLQIFMSFSGGLATTAFAPVIFKDVGYFGNPYVGSILLGAVRTVVTVFCGILLERVQRKTLLMVDAVLGSAACFFAGCFFHFSVELKEYNWVLLVLILAIVCFMSIGISPVLNVMLSELLPNAVRTELGGVCLFTFGLLNFLMAYSFPLAQRAFGMASVYWFFAVMHGLMFVFAVFCLPHTGGKTIEEIQKMFVKTTVNAAGEPVNLHVEERRGSLCVESVKQMYGEENTAPSGRGT